MYPLPFPPPSEGEGEGGGRRFLWVIDLVGFIINITNRITHGGRPDSSGGKWLSCF